MKKTSLPTLALVLTTAIFGLAGSSPASADALFTIHIGSQAPPPPHEEHQWARPDPTAVWIPGHNEWTGREYVWVDGYYTYPPHKREHWVGPAYDHGQNGYSYRAGHWSK